MECRNLTPLDALAYNRHLIPDVLGGIEQQKQEDQKRIAATTGKVC
jgi:hypothetical protein